MKHTRSGQWWKRVVSLPAQAADAALRADENANYGGQAVLEGVMIRSPKALAVAVRRLDGTIVLKKDPLVPLTRRHRLLNIPFIRGTFALADALTTGLRALSFSADVAMEEENERLAAARRVVAGAGVWGKGRGGEWENGGVGERENGRAGAGRPEAQGAGEDSPIPPFAHSPTLPFSGSPTPPLSHSPIPPGEIQAREVATGKGVPWWSLALSMVASMGIAVVVFVMLPDLLVRWALGRPIGWGASFGVNLTEGLVRLGFFIIYILAITRMEPIRRVFEYHGAEHQVIYAFENGDPVTPKYASRYDTAHPRCGTSFLGVVLMVGIVAFSLVEVHTWYARLGAKLALLPAIAGISYEVIRLAGSGRFTFLVAPGLWLQRLTTRRPTPDQVEVAIAALGGVLEQEGRSLHRASETAGD